MDNQLVDSHDQSSVIISHNFDHEKAKNVFYFLDVSKGAQKD